MGASLSLRREANKLCRKKGEVRRREGSGRTAEEGKEETRRNAIGRARVRRADRILAYTRDHTRLET